MNKNIKISFSLLLVFALMLALIFLLAAQSALALFVGGIVSEIAIDASAVAAAENVCYRGAKVSA